MRSGVIERISRKKLAPALMSGAMALLLGGAAATCVRADTTYTIAFTNSVAGPTIGNGSGTFTINNADQMTSFSASFPVLKAYSFDGASGSPGEVLTFTDIVAGATSNGYVTYDPATGIFGYGTNYLFELKEVQPSNPNNAAELTIRGGEPILDNAYGVNALGDGTFTRQFDPDGTWTVKASSGPSAVTPEPGSFLQMSEGLSAFVLAWILLKRRNGRLWFKSSNTPA